MSLSTAERFSLNKRFKIETGDFNHYAIKDSVTGDIQKKQWWSFLDAVAEQNKLECAIYGM